MDVFKYLNKHGIFGFDMVSKDGVVTRYEVKHNPSVPLPQEVHDQILADAAPVPVQVFEVEPEPYTNMDIFDRG